MRFHHAYDSLSPRRLFHLLRERIIGDRTPRHAAATVTYNSLGHIMTRIAVNAADSHLFSAAALAAQPTVGRAPEFELPDQDGQLHSLEDYRDQWVVLYFYPKDETPGCTTEACEFRDDIFAFRELNAQILGVSLDDVESHKAFAEKYGLPFPLLADVKVRRPMPMASRRACSA